MRLSLSFDMDNDSFESNAAGEAANVLREMARKVAMLPAIAEEMANSRLAVYDTNGNNIGSLSITDGAL